MSGRMDGAVAVVGLQWGDEGKGKIVDWLARRAAHVARFQGGHNAGHSLVVGGEKTVLHLLPSGILHPHARCYIGGGVVVAPDALLEEIARARAGGIELEGRLFVSSAAAMILPYHLRVDAARDAKNKIGTTGRGIGPAHEDKVGRRALRLYDAAAGGGGWARLEDNVDFYNYVLARHGAPALEAAALWADVTRQVAELQPFLVDDVGEALAVARGRGEAILLEGAQGALLDGEVGTYPYTTSAPCLAAAAAAGLGVELHAAVLGVAKCYCTRVGNGPFPSESAGGEGAVLAERGGEVGATTGRARRCGWLDAPMLRYAVRVNGCAEMVVTKLDVLDAFDEVKICVAYALEGERLELPPADAERLRRCTPIYETWPGWRGAGGVAEAGTWAALPAAARRFLARMEELSGAEVAAVSVGAERGRTLVRDGGEEEGEEGGEGRDFFAGGVGRRCG